MGQQRVQLGMHVVATALPADEESTAQPDDVVLYFGIIDILQVRQPCTSSSPQSCSRESDN